MGFFAYTTWVDRFFVAGALAVWPAPWILAESAPAPKAAGEQADAGGTLSIAPQFAARAGGVERQTSERLRAVVLGASPTLAEPPTPPGIAALAGVPAIRAGSRKTAWMDYMLDSGVPAWSLRLTTKSQFEVHADRPADAAPAVFVSEAAATATGFGRFDLSAAGPSGATSSVAPSSWTTLGGGGRSVLLPTPLASMRDSPLSSSEAALLSAPLAAPPSVAGAAAGAASLPLLPGQ